MTRILTANSIGDADVVACFISSDGEQPRIGRDLAALAAESGVDVSACLTSLHVTGAADEVGRVPLTIDGRTRLVLVVGLGEQPDIDALRRSAAVAAHQATKDALLAIVVPGDAGGAGNADNFHVARDVGTAGAAGDAGGAHDIDATAAARAVAEGAGLGAYAYTTYRTKQHDAPSLTGIAIVPGRGVDPKTVDAGVRQGRAIATATNITRDLINTPPSFKRPPALADRVAELADEAGVGVRIFDDVELADGGFGGLIGVGRGSSEGPRLVELTYEGADRTSMADASEGAVNAERPHVVLVGKGITFDSGGLSLKPSGSMATMKSDMSGAAAVVGAVLSAAELQLAPRVTGLLALAENMPDGGATRVSDVLTHRNGTTVEVMNTDAEGRLVLADALSYGVELEPTAMIDLATLTGGQIVALGNRIAALMGTDDELLAAVEVAAAQAGERVWRLPLPADYREQLRSEVADLRNIGKPRQAQAIIAGLFLREFTGDTPWAHLDIAGPAFSDTGDGPLAPKGASGFGVRTLVAYLETLG